MTLRGSRQKLSFRKLKYLETSFRQMFIKMSHIFREFPEIETEKGGEDRSDNVRRELSVGEHIEVTHKPVCDESSTSSWWPHSTKDNQVFKFHKKQSLSIIPAFVIHKLPNQLKGRLCSIGFLFGHVQIINKNYAFFAYGWTVVSFSSFLHLTVDGILGLISSSLSWKR